MRLKYFAKWNAAKISATLLGAHLCLAGCLSGSEVQKEPEPLVVSSSEIDILTSDTLFYETKNFFIQSDLVFEDEIDGFEPTHFSVQYPHFENQNINSFVNRSFLGTDSPPLEETAQTFIEEYETHQKTIDLPKTWFSDTKTTVHINTAAYLGLKTETYSYTGGAHGIYATLFSHYSVAENKELFLHDFIADENMLALKNVAETYFWIQEQERYGENFSQGNYFFDTEGFYIAENVAFEADSLLFLYNIYEIKPYVDGITELRVPYSELDHILTEKAKAIITTIKKNTL